jgi:aminoglycoside phosphotransferase (APT) family kinase protein
VQDLLSIIDLALQELERRHGGDPADLRVACREQRELLAEGEALLAQRPSSTSPSSALPAQPPPLDSLKTWDELQRELDRTRGALSSLIQEIQRDRALQLNSDWRNQAAQWTRKVLQSEIRQCCFGFEPPAAHGANTDESTQTPLPAYFAEKLGASKPVADVALSPLSGGFSRDTLLVTLNEHVGSTRSAVLRKNRRNGLIEGVGLPLRNEFSIVSLAHRLGLPVPRPLWYEDDSSILGDEFFASERVQGENLGSFTDGVRLDSSTIKEIAYVLARLHAIEWEAHATELLPALRQSTSQTCTVASALSATITRWRKLCEGANVQSPALSLAFDWLLAHVPDGDRKPVFLHGDAGVHNMLFQEGKLVALLDWELADLGDPARDLLLMREQISSHVPWHQFMDWYQSAGGRSVSDEVLSFYEAFISTTGLACHLVAIEDRFESAKPSNIQYLKLGYLGLPYFAQRFANAMDRMTDS